MSSFFPEATNAQERHPSGRRVARYARDLKACNL